MWLMAWLLVLHFIADFPLQSRRMGKEKSEKFFVLYDHLAVHWYVFFFGLIFIIGIWDAMTIANVNAVIHGIIDWNIWRAYKYRVWRWAITKSKKMGWAETGGVDGGPMTKDDYMYVAKSFEYWNDHWFYTTIGFDQLLHGLTLVLCYGLFIR